MTLLSDALTRGVPAYIPSLAPKMYAPPYIQLITGNLAFPFSAFPGTYTSRNKQSSEVGPPPISFPKSLLAARALIVLASPINLGPSNPFTIEAGKLCAQVPPCPP